jgi:mRNA interferase MazF
MRSVDARRIKNKQGVLEDIYWRDLEKAVCVELGFG